MSRDVKFRVLMACMLIGAGWSSTVLAANPAPAIRTVPPDEGYGAHVLSADQRYAPLSQSQARVDRRASINAASDRGILFPTALVPPAGRFSITSYDIALEQLSYSVSNHLLVSAAVHFPFASRDVYGMLSAKYVVRQSDEWTFSVLPFAVYRAGTAALRTTELGLGIGAVADFPVTDQLIVTAGVLGYVPALFQYDSLDYASCQDRAAFIQGSCVHVNTTSRAFPAGGRWLAGYISGTYYLSDTVSFTAEAATAVANGSFLAINSQLYQPLTIPQEQRAYANGPIKMGVPYGAGLTVGFAGSWAHGPWALQLAVYFGGAPPAPFTSGGRSVSSLVVPVFAATYRF